MNKNIETDLNHTNNQLMLNSAINFSELSQQVSFKHLFNYFPAFIFLKDKKGKYLDVNTLKLQKMGLNHINDIIGLNDFDLCFKKEEVTFLQKNDLEIIAIRDSKNFIEQATLADGKQHQILSFKSPFTLPISKKLLGVLGVSFILPVENIQTNENQKKIFAFLTSRQNDCLYYFVCHGMTIKEISKQLQLSPRTIEHHLEEVKLKLNCSTRSMLMKKYYEL